MTDRAHYREREQQARARAEAASSAALSAIYRRIAGRYALLADQSDSDARAGAARGR